MEFDISRNFSEIGIVSIRFPEQKKEHFVTFYSVTGLTFMINGAGDETKVADEQSACSC